jgi:hypothetical protein
MARQSDNLVPRKARDYFAAALSLGIALGLLFGTRNDSVVWLGTLVTPASTDTSHFVVNPK